MSFWLADQIYSYLTGFLFPPCCIMCNSPGGWLCKNCQNTYLLNNLPECGACRKISASYLTHQTCLEKFPISRMIVCWQYNLLGKKLMAIFKYKYRYSVIAHFMELATRKVEPLPPSDTILIPVPSPPSRARERGFT